MTAPILAGAGPFRFDGGGDGILMIHGFSGSPASMRPMGEWFAAHGLSVIGVRLPGHGTTIEDFRAHRWPEWAEAVERGLDELASSADRIVVFAQSFGAALAVHLAATREPDVHGLALTSPYLFDARLVFLPLARLFVKEKKGVGDDIRAEHVGETAYERIPADAIATMSAFLKIARRDLPNVRAPALVFRPGEDHTIPPGNPEKVYERLGSARKELVDCPSSYHVISLDHDAPMVRERVLELVRSV